MPGASFRSWISDPQSISDEPSGVRRASQKHHHRRFNHGHQPIPAASRVGPLVATGGVYGLDPKSGEIVEGVEAQAELTFLQLRRILAAAGASLDDVVRMTFYVKVPEARAAINAQWLQAFPDEASRPARHTMVNESLPTGMLLQCDALAFVTEAPAGSNAK